MRYSVVAGVVLEKTVYRFDKPFDYSVPTELLDVCKVGCRVTVPFGRGNIKRQGLVIYLSNGAININDTQIKNIISVVDKKPLLTKELVGIVKWLKANTFCTYYDAVKTLLPFGLNIKMVSTLSLESDVSAERLANLSKTENDIVAFLRKKGGLAEKKLVLSALHLNDDSAINTLLNAGIISVDRTAKQNMKDPTVSMASLLVPVSDLPKLTAKQKAVVEFLDEVNTAGVKEIAYYAGVTQAVITTLEKKGILKVFQTPIVQVVEQNISQNSSEIVLTDEQQNAYDNLLLDYNASTSKTSLLYGVTGSGKTSIFLKLVDHTISNGKSAIVMLYRYMVAVL